MPLEKTNNIKVCRQVRPDDVRIGDFVAVLCETYEWPTIFCGSEFGPAVQRATLVPNQTDEPVRVEAVCVPFVFVVDAAGVHRVIDMRRVTLARVAKRFGRAVFASGAARKSGKRCKKCGGQR